jgi:SAM-dependent methyltransferase
VVRDPFRERFFPNEPAHWLAYPKEIADLLPRRGNILDLGCGDNTTLDRFRQRGLEIWGADYQRHPGLCHPDRFRLVGPDGQIPFVDGTFDVIAAQWVLEHVAKPRQFLKEVCRVLKPGGTFVALSVSALHYVAWLRQMFGVLPHSAVQRLVYRLYKRAEHDTFPTYYRLNTASRLQDCGRAAGLFLKRFRTYANQGYFVLAPTLYRVAIVADWLLEKTAPGFGRIYFTAMMEKPTSAGSVREDATRRAA